MNNYIEGPIISLNLCYQNITLKSMLSRPICKYTHYLPRTSQLFIYKIKTVLHKDSNLIKSFYHKAIVCVATNENIFTKQKRIEIHTIFKH